MNQRESRIETIIDEYHEDKRLSGTILISKERTVIFEKAYGEASIQLGVPNRLDTKFHIACGHAIVNGEYCSGGSAAFYSVDGISDSPISCDTDVA